MKSMILKESKNTPGISFHAETGMLEISGRSMLENNEEFYRPLIEWIENYALHPASETVLNFRLKYFNIGSAKYFLEMIKKIEKLYLGGANAAVYWYHDAADTDLKHAGEDFQNILKLPFHIVQNP